jgi:hypothetical protein
MTCPHCNFEVPALAQFCLQCGTRVLQPAPPLSHSSSVRAHQSKKSPGTIILVAVGLLAVAVAVWLYAKATSSHKLEVRAPSEEAPGLVEHSSPRTEPPREIVKRESVGSEFFGSWTGYYSPRVGGILEDTPSLWLVITKDGDRFKVTHRRSDGTEWSWFANYANGKLVDLRGPDDITGMTPTLEALADGTIREVNEGEIRYKKETSTDAAAPAPPNPTTSPTRSSGEGNDLATLLVIDSTLGAVYSARLESVMRLSGRAARDALRDQQRKWIIERDRDCHYDSARLGFSAITDFGVLQCFVRWGRERIPELAGSPTIGRESSSEPTLSHLFPAIPAGYVTDAAGAVNAVSVARINQLARQLQENTKTEIAVAVLPTIGDRAPVDVAVAIARAWGIGAKGSGGNPGRTTGIVILLVPRREGAPNSGQVFIATGQGLEGIVTDLEAGRVRDLMRPYFRDLQYGEGLVQGVQELASIVTGGMGVGASAQAHPNLTGTWVLQLERSDFGGQPSIQSRTDVIEHNEPKLTIKRTIEYSGEVTTTTGVYAVDGTLYKNRNGQTTWSSTLRWDGPTLVIVSDFVTPQMEYTVTDRYTLSADGNTLGQTRRYRSAVAPEASQKLLLLRQP